MTRKVVDIDERRLSLSNLEKELYPSYGFTKARVLEYYTKVSPFILPHLKDRALTLKRYPDGVNKDFFFEKRCPSHRPSWVKTGEVIHDEERITACLVNDLETLIWVENLASLELHVPQARFDSPNTPDYMVFDLDPGDEANILDCARVALVLRDLLSGMHLVSFAKTTGRNGLHVYVPLNNKETTFEDTKGFSKAVATVMQKNYPDLVTVRMAKEHRKGKVFINWSQNDPKKTMICVYSLRARERPLVSFPIAWDELEEGQDNQKRLEIIHSEALSRVEKDGDPFREVIEKKQRLPYL